VAGRAGALRAIASSLPSSTCTWQGRPRPTPKLCSAGTGRLKHAPAVVRPVRYGQRLNLVEGTSPRGLTFLSTVKAGNIYSAPLHICRVVLLLLNAFPWQGRWRPTPRFCASGAASVTTAEACVSAAAMLRQKARACPRYIAVGCSRGV
jgi:hypothetical protein